MVYSYHSVLITRRFIAWNWRQQVWLNLKLSHQNRNQSVHRVFNQIRQRSSTHTDFCCQQLLLHSLHIFKKHRNLIFLDIGDAKPVSLFSVWNHLAAIGDKGEVIFINRDSFKISPNSLIEAFYLPFGMKASCVVCLNKLVFALASNGQVSSSTI